MLNLGQLNTIKAYIEHGQFEALDEYLSQVYGKLVMQKIADKNFLEGINKAIQVCNELDDGDHNQETHFYYEALDNVKSQLEQIKSNFTV